MHRIALLLTLILLCPVLCHGHKLRVYAWVEQGVIMGEASFHGGKKAKHVKVIIELEGQQSPLAATKTDDTGSFSLPIPDTINDAPTDLLIIADSGDGHRNEWLIEHSELKQGLKVQSDSEQARTIDTNNPSPRHGSSINRTTAESRLDEISIKDILAGLSIIFGLAGLTVYLKKRRKIS